MCVSSAAKSRRLASMISKGSSSVLDTQSRRSAQSVSFSTRWRPFSQGCQASRDRHDAQRRPSPNPITTDYRSFDAKTPCPNGSQYVASRLRFCGRVDDLDRTGGAFAAPPRNGRRDRSGSDCRWNADRAGTSSRAHHRSKFFIKPFTT